MRRKQHIWVGGLVSVFAAVAAGTFAFSFETQPANASTEKPSAFAQRLAFAPMGDPVSDLVVTPSMSARYAKEAAQQRQCLAEAVYYEARSETLSGQKAVAEVVMNRVKSKHFPRTICGVVYQGAERRTGCQFSFTCDGALKNEPRGRHWTRAENVASLAMTKGADTLTKRATHYHTTAINPEWSETLVETDTYGAHVFYRFKNRREVRESRAAAMLAVAPPS